MVDLFPDWCFVMEPLQSSFDILWHGDVNFVALVIPIKREYNIFFTILIFRYVIVLFEYTNNGVYMFFALVFESENSKTNRVTVIQPKGSVN